MKMDVFQWFRCFRRVPPFGASSWPLAGFLLASGLLLASCLPLAGLLLASCWPLAGLLLATSFPTKISLENRFFTRLAKLVNSLHENGCFSMVSVFRGVPPIWGLFLASWPLAGLLLASCWLLGLLLASCWPLAGLLLAKTFLDSAGRLRYTLPLREKTLAPHDAHDSHDIFRKGQARLEGQRFS